MFLSLLKLITERPRSELTFLTEIHNKRGLVDIFFYFCWTGTSMQLRLHSLYSTLVPVQRRLLARSLLSRPFSLFLSS